MSFFAQPSRVIRVEKNQNGPESYKVKTAGINLRDGSRRSREGALPVGSSGVGGHLDLAAGVCLETTNLFATASNDQANHLIGHADDLRVHETYINIRTINYGATFLTLIGPSTT